MHSNDISSGDVVTYRLPSYPGKKYYGMVVELSGPNRYGRLLHNPDQWIRVRWFGGGPFHHEWDLINHTTTLVEKYVQKKKKRKRKKRR